MLRTAFLILSGNIFNAFALFARNMLIARLLSVKDYGIASTFSISMAIVEMMTSLGLQHMIVQSKSGNDPRFQAALQGFNLLRSSISSLALFLLAAPIAYFLDVEEVIWAYQVLAIVPILAGAMHFDVHRLNRKMNYLPIIMTYALSATLSIVLIWPLYLLFGDYRVMLFAMISQHMLALIFSHVFAERGYRISFDRNVISAAFQFGWPLWVDTVLLFAIFNGEKLIVGHELDIEILAVFTLGFSLTLAPTLIVNRTVQSFFLPQLSSVKESGDRFRHLAVTTLQSYVAAGSMAALAIYFLGGPFIVFFFGDKYLSVIPLLPLLAVFQSIRVFKGGLSTVSLALGYTKIPMMINVVRVLFLPAAWYIVSQNSSLPSMIMIGIVGELVSLAVGFLILAKHVHILSKATLLPTFAALAMFALVVSGDLVSGFLSTSALALSGSSIVILFLFIVSLVSMTDLQTYLRKRVVSAYDD